MCFFRFFSGSAAGLAIGMIVLGVFLGVIGLLVGQKLKERYNSPDRRNILNEYLNDNTKY